MTKPAFGTRRNPRADEVRTLIGTLRAPSPTAPGNSTRLREHPPHARKTSGPDSSDVLAEPDALVVDALPEHALVDDRLGAALLDRAECDAVKVALRRAGLPSFDRLS
jgi:hypothetical protein